LDQEIKTKLFTTDDLDKIIHINRLCLPENYGSSFFLDIHRRYPRTFIVATQNGNTIGYIMCRIETGFSSIRKLKIAKRGHIISLAVLPENRKQGVAYALLSHALKNVCNYGADECYLEVRISNDAAIALYQSLNFTISRRILGYYRDGEDAFVMTKSPVCEEI
jgi:ribosomal-protein-alanine N-acetyltransferase